MAVTDIPTEKGMHYELHTVTITADGSAVIQMPDRAIGGISITSDGVDGGGTLTALVSNDNVNYSAVSASIPSTPLTVHTFSETGAGNWTLDRNNLSFHYLKFTLASSTGPALVLTVKITYAV